MATMRNVQSVHTHWANAQIVSACLSSPHSPSNCGKAELTHKVFDFWRRKGLCKHVSHHVLGRVINKSNFVLLNNPMNEMVPDINVFCACMVLVDLCKCSCQLVVQRKWW
jgi:hypothetical protein